MNLDDNRVLIEDIIASMVPRKRSSKARKKVLVPLLKTAAKIQKLIEVAQAPTSTEDSIFLPIEAAEQPELTSDDESASNDDVESFFVKAFNAYANGIRKYIIVATLFRERTLND